VSKYRSFHKMRMAGKCAASSSAGDAGGMLTMEGLLSAENLVKEYVSRGVCGAKTSVHALDQVNLTIQSGARIAIVGESGSGKSTLAACLACLEMPTSGTIRFQNRNLTELSERELRDIRPSIQLVFQDPATAFNPNFSVRDVLEEPWVLRATISKEQRRERANELLTKVGLARNIADRKSADLSGGQRQRLAIARALALEPKVLILDEALSALDYSVQAQIANLLLDLSDRKIPLAERPSIVLITHDLVMAARFADEIVVMQTGRIVESGPVQGIIRNPEHSVTRTLLASTMRSNVLTEKRSAV
jgi:ABC-type glutathione transport system ATPase component